MSSRSQTRNVRLLAALAIALLVSPVTAEDAPAQPSRPDGKPADMSKPVQVFILMGQHGGHG